MAQFPTGPRGERVVRIEYAADGVTLVIKYRAKNWSSDKSCTVVAHWHPNGRRPRTPCGRDEWRGSDELPWLADVRDTWFIRYPGGRALNA